MLRATHKKGCNRLSLANTIRQIVVEVQRSEERNPTPEKKLLYNADGSIDKERGESKQYHYCSFIVTRRPSAVGIPLASPIAIAG